MFIYSKGHKMLPLYSELCANEFVTKNLYLKIHQVIKENLRKIFICIITFFASFLSVFDANAQTITTFITSGTWTAPCGVATVQVECWGAGGAGGGSTSTAAGGGGGGGGYSKSTISVIAGTNYGYIVGAGGAGALGADGSGGGLSSFYGGTIANGGVGGKVLGTAGAGGTGTNFSGGNGAAGIAGTSSGGGGASAGTAANGANASGITGGTTGSGAGADGRLAASWGDGSIGAIIGGAGSGGIRNSGTRIGGVGARGQVTITYTLVPNVTPTAQPTSLILTPNLTDISGSFNGSSSADAYLVVMTTTASAPTSPVDGTTYTVGATALGGKIISISANTSFIATGLTASTQYWFWVYSYTGSCSGTKKYLVTSPLNGSTTTLVCGVPTNTVTISTYGTGTFNWSALSWSLGHIPTSCENVVLIVDRSAATADEIITVNYDTNFTVNNFTMRNISNTARRVVFGNSGNKTLNILGNLTIECPGGASGNYFNRCVFTNVGSTTINGDITLGRIGTSTTAKEGHSGIGSTGTTPGQTYTLFGNMTFNPRGYTTDEWTVFIFNKAGTQYIYNNTRPLTTDTTMAVLFEDLRIGTTNATTLVMAGTGSDGYIENVGRAGVSIGVNSTLDLPANYSLNNILGGTFSFFKMLAGSKLRLGGDRSMPSASGVSQGTAYGVSGSNFPIGFNYTFDTTSTIEYYGNSTLTQTIYHAPTYQILIASNGSAAGRAQKITTNPITINKSFNINALADVTLGTLGSSTQTVACAGPLNVNTNAGLYCNANVISGLGAFTMASASTLGMGHAQGIAYTAEGNVQMTSTRTYSTTGNYLYNGIVTQITGLGLPASAINDLTIDNPTTVTIANNQLVNGITNLKQGTFDIGTTQFTSNGVGTITSVSGKMKADLGTVEMKGTTGTEQNLSGNWFVNKTIANLIDFNTKGIIVAASPADTLLISTTLNYGASTTASTITTNDNLTLLSRVSGTASFGNSTGNTITGKVNVERYMFAKSAWRLLATPIQIGTSPTIAQAWREGNAALSSTGYGTRITGPAGPYGAANVLDEYTQRGSFKTFNSTSNLWVETTNSNTTVIANTKGRLVFVRGDRGAAIGAVAATNLRMKGDLLTGDQTFAVPASKYESFGNPYPARIDFTTITKSNIVDAFTVWNPNSAGLYSVGAYETFVKSAGVYQRGAVIRNFIESGEAVFIQNNTASAGSITVKETDKGTGSSNVSRGTTADDNPDEPIPTLEISMYAQNPDASTYLADYLMVNFDSSFSADIDNDDVRKFTNTYDNIGIKNGMYNLVAERRPNLNEIDSIKLNISGMRIAPYLLEIAPSLLDAQGIKAILIDKFLQTETVVSMTELTKVNFKCTNEVASRAADRFLITFKLAPTTNFISITAARNVDKTITINWGTQNENRITNYTVGHSIDGINFSAIVTEPLCVENNTKPTYSKQHLDASKGKNWYRVIANNVGGSTKYSAITMVNELTESRIAEIPSMSIYPNPVVNGQVNLHLDNQLEGTYVVSISNKIGQVLQSVTTKVNGKNMQATINIGLLNTGPYQVTVTNNDGKKTTLPFLMR